MEGPERISWENVLFDIVPVEGDIMLASNPRLRLNPALPTRPRQPPPSGTRVPERRWGNIYYMASVKKKFTNKLQGIFTLHHFFASFLC